MQERLTDLEIRYTHQERLVEELSQVMHEQRRAIEGLEERVRDLERRVRAVEDPIGDEVPPHY
jgi:SlyX protein